MAAKKKEPKFPPPREDEATGAAGDILVSFIGSMIRRVPLGDIEIELDRATGPLAAPYDEKQPLGALARLIADRLVADMEVSTPIGASDEAAS